MKKIITLVLFLVVPQFCFAQEFEEKDISNLFLLTDQTEGIIRHVTEHQVDYTFVNPFGRKYWIQKSDKLLGIQIQSWPYQEPFTHEPIVPREEDVTILIDFYGDGRVDYGKAPEYGTYAEGGSQKMWERMQDLYDDALLTLQEFIANQE